MMQNADVYVEVNKNTAKYSDMWRFLKHHEQLLTWKPEEVVLDVGCGPGDVTACVLQQWMPSDFRCILGVDVSSKLIKHAGSMNTNDKLEFMTVDIGADVSEILQNEKYADGFDKIFSFYVLHWLDDLERGLRNLYSLLKPGGQALVTFPVDRHFQKTYRIVRTKHPWCAYIRGMKRPLHPFPVTSDPAQEFQVMLESAGFKVSKCEVKDDHAMFGSMDTVKALIESLDQDVGCIPSDLKAQYLQDCVQIMEEMDAVCVDKCCVKQTMLTCLFKKPRIRSTHQES